MNTLATTPPDGFRDYPIERFTPLDWESVTYAGDIMITRDGRIVCIEQSRGIDITGGHRDSGESPLEAVTREVREEIGHDIHTPVILSIREWIEPYKGIENPKMVYYTSMVNRNEAELLSDFNNRAREHADEVSSIVCLSSEQYLERYRRDRPGAANTKNIENMEIAVRAAIAHWKSQKKIDIGLIGLGDHQIRWHLVPLNTDNRVGAISVYDPKWEEAISNLRSKYLDIYPGVDSKLWGVSSTIDTLVQNSSVRALFICSPDQFHMSQMTAGLAAGKHIFCEKPLIHTTSEGDQLIENIHLARAQWLTLSSCHPRRFDTPFVWLRSYISWDHPLWEITDLHFDFRYPAPGEWKEWLHSGLLSDHFNHEIDLLHFYFWFSHFTAQKLYDSQVEYAAEWIREDGIWFRFTGERKSAQWAQYAESITITGELWSIRVDTKSGEATLTKNEESTVVHTGLQTDYIGRFQKTTSNFIDTIVAGWRSYLGAHELLMNNMSWVKLSELWVFDSREYASELAGMM